MPHLPKMHNDKNIHFSNFLGNGKIDFLKSILFDNMNSTEKKEGEGWNGNLREEQADKGVPCPDYFC